MTHTLKLKGDMSLPGLALPEAFETLDSRLESVMQLSVAKGSPEAQVVGLITVCEELKQLLKCAFIENGMLASRIEILTRYQMESVKKMEKKVSNVDVENKVTRKHMKRLRRKLNAQLVMQKKKDGNWWDVTVRTTDYDSFVTLSRAGGYPDLEFMLRVNQLMIDFVRDSSQTELVLPPMGLEERQEVIVNTNAHMHNTATIFKQVSKLASIYKLRCRYGKSVQIAPSTLLKARQACVPAAGEVDAILNNFARSHVQRKATEEVVVESEVSAGAVGKEPVPSGSGSSKEERAKPPAIPLPSTMLTPIPTLPSPTIDISSLKHPSHSPPSSTLATPTATTSEGSASRFLKQQREGLVASGGAGVGGPSSSSSALTDRKSSVATQSGSLASPAVPGSAPRPHPQTTPLNPRPADGKRSVVSASVGKGPSASMHAPSETRIPPPSTSSIPSTSAPMSSMPPPSPAAGTSIRPLPPPTSTNLPPPPSPSGPSGKHHTPIGIVLAPSSAGGTRSPGGGVLVQPQIRGPSSHSTVLALPIPSPSSQTSPESARSLRKEREGNGKKRTGAGDQEGEEGTVGEVLGGGGGGGGGSARTDSMGPPVKRVRVTRRSAAEEELAKQ